MKFKLCFLVLFCLLIMEAKADFIGRPIPSAPFYDTSYVVENGQVQQVVKENMPLIFEARKAVIDATGDNLTLEEIKKIAKAGELVIKNVQTNFLVWPESRDITYRLVDNRIIKLVGEPSLAIWKIIFNYFLTFSLLFNLFLLSSCRRMFIFLVVSLVLIWGYCLFYPVLLFLPEGAYYFLILFGFIVVNVWRKGLMVDSGTAGDILRLSFSGILGCLWSVSIMMYQHMLPATLLEPFLWKMALVYTSLSFLALIIVFAVRFDKAERIFIIKNRA